MEIISRCLCTIFKCQDNAPNTSIEQLDVLHKTEELQIKSWNPSDPFSVQTNACMHDLVSNKIREVPASAKAICSWDGSLTYMELDRLSDIAAGHLRFAGARLGTYVPFAFEKSMWAVVAALGILKAGAAFMPLNPLDPKMRLEQLVKVVGAKVVATSEAFEGLFSDSVDSVVVLSRDTTKMNQRIESGECAANLETARKPCPEDPIFVLFTSGSTGTAKGMIHTHSAICTHALVHGQRMGYHCARVLQFAAHTFDVAIMDIFTTLLFGGCICIPSEESRRGNIVEAIGCLRADYAILTPSFAGTLDPSDVPTLRTLAVGGEALPQERIQRWAEKVRLIQIYGPAEVGICLAMDMRASTRPETVGQPLDNSSCWLVDPDCSEILVPIGAVGELVVAGPSLAQGYLNDERRTSESFIHAPKWAHRYKLSFERFYMTGDLLRYNLDSLDGSFDFVGRKDIQIKLRGQRIEPGEIEYHIGRIPGVAVCMATRPERGCLKGELVAVMQMDSCSAAFTDVRDDQLCLAHVQCLRGADVRKYLQNLVPAYMVPSTALTVQRMPFVPSMKVDRKRVERWLADMETKPLQISLTHLEGLDSDEITANALSSKIAEYLTSKDELQALRLQGHDFPIHEAGIDSIQITSLSMFLRKTHKAEIPVEVLFNSKLTIRKLAMLVDASSLDTMNGHDTPSSPQAANVDVREEAALLYQSLINALQSERHHKAISRTRSPVYNVLITGATGYLGTAILHQLLTIPDVHIYALIRCADPTSGLTRIRQTLTAHNPWHSDTHAFRIHVWPGDLGLPNLGLQPQHLHQLLGHDGVQANDAIHAFIHNGAIVHYGHDYETLKSCNVNATLDALRLAAQATYLHSFVFVSGGVLPSFDILHSAADVSHTQQLHTASGYTQTKQVSETLVRQCMHSEPSIRAKMPPSMRVVKPGYIIGNARDGIANRSDFIWRLVVGCVDIGAYNGDDVAKWLYVADTDCVAEAVVTGIRLDIDTQGGAQRHKDDGGEENPGNAVVKITSGLRFGALWTILRDEYKYQLVPLPRAQWLARLLEHVVVVGEGHVLYPLLHILEQSERSIGEDVAEEEGVESSEGVREAVVKNVEFLIGVGFLPRSGGGSGGGGADSGF